MQTQGYHFFKFQEHYPDGCADQTGAEALDEAGQAGHGGGGQVSQEAEL